MFTLSSQELAAIKKDYTIKEAYIPEPDWKEVEEMDRMRRELYERDADKFMEIENMTTDDYFAIYKLAKL